MTVVYEFCIVGVQVVSIPTATTLFDLSLEIQPETVEFNVFLIEKGRERIANNGLRNILPLEGLTLTGFQVDIKIEKVDFGRLLIASKT